MKRIFSDLWQVISAVLWAGWCLFLVIVILRFMGGEVLDVTEFILKVGIISILLMIVDLRMTLMAVKKESRNSTVFITVLRDYLKSKSK